MDREEETLIYLYGVVPADAPDPPPELRGLEDRPVRLVRAGGLAAVVGSVSAAEYGEEALDARLADLEWVGQRALVHERVLDWMIERAPLVPLSVFSLHRDEARVRTRLESGAPQLRELLERLSGRREWGVKLWRDETQVAGSLDELSPALRALAREIEQAPPGRRFLLAKKRDAARAEELRRVSARVAHEVFAALRDEAERAVSFPLPPQAPQGGRALVLHAAFLLPGPALAGFQRRLGELAGEFQPFGFAFEFTGPWAPYHFTETDVS